MSSSGSVGSAIGRGPTIEHKGKDGQDRVYDLAPMDHVQVIADFEAHLRGRALQEVDKTRQLMGPLAGDVAMRAYLDNATAGVYDFASPFWLESIRSPAHQKAILWFCLRAKDRTVTRQLAEQIYKDCGEQVERLFYGDPAAEAAQAVEGEGEPGNGATAAGSGSSPAAG